MIVLQRKEDCCGCHACATACPTQCITMREDAEGFLYPETDVSKCIDCHLCEKVCPVINTFPRPEVFPNELPDPLSYAAKISDEQIRDASSSGGIFTALAESVIRKGGVVFGVRWSEDFKSVVHDYTETIEGLSVFRGSKYLQSIVGDSYKKVRQFLTAKRPVLFTGTPCQIAGLRRFLRKDYENLFTAEVVCHGVPSPKVWRLYLDEQVGKIQNGGEAFGGMEKIQRGSLRSPGAPDAATSVEIENIGFRGKVAPGGWKKYSYVLSYKPPQSGGEIQLRFVREQLDRNVYMRAFLRDICLRPSCYECPSKAQTSGSDITLGDFWGAWNYEDLSAFNDNKGTSLVCANTEKGKSLLSEIAGTCRFKVVPYEWGLKGNPALAHNPKRHPKREMFFGKLNGGEKLYDFVLPITKLPLKRAIRGKVFSYAFLVLHKLGLLEIAKRILKKN